MDLLENNLEIYVKFMSNKLHLVTEVTSLEAWLLAYVSKHVNVL
jgi:hypothetical protein